MPPSCNNLASRGAGSVDVCKTLQVQAPIGGMRGGKGATWDISSGQLRAGLARVRAREVTRLSAFISAV
eukprot:CAMPEP_0206044168 /NCGR_PEP_ID=MMETSP1466-20131121/11772_1 /ASSEMBLY_ACC=CAM_ASM_001126 /TAXON_ID=44452 /ORGANISM="Pavlova gyrans, Strain CCMP608" /LENGTH=68 /DNA_ID=CAMNT_0053419051 /DNA_START=14 /DNA_END=218 /DNA_ORIENTATION=+